MGSNGFDHPLKDVDEEGVSIRKTLNEDSEQTGGIDEPMNVEYMSSIKEYNAHAFQRAEKQKTNSLEQSSVVEISQSKEWDVSSSPRRSLDHCITAPITLRDSLTDVNEFRYSRSVIEKRMMPRDDLKLDRLSEREKKKLIVELVRIQNDGTVEVDLDKSAPVASEFMEFQPVEGPPIILDDTSFSESKKSIPRLNIAILVVGMRGDVQPFLAMAKRLQEFGHRVRLATHANFKTFARSSGVDFFPLGGDPRVLAGYMARNKGLIPSGPGEISIQRKQLKAIIESLLPACTDRDIESGVPFRAQAIIANPPAYGHAHVAEALGVPIHIFFTMPWTPTYEFPHPLARVPQSSGYWLSYIIVDLLIWWGIRSYINDFRKRKLKLPPIAYFSKYHGSISHLPTGYMWSPHLVPKPSDWGPVVDVVGYCFLNLGSKYQPQEKIVQWIQKGPEPIYIGFGSMPLEDPKKITEIILEALKDTGQRGIIDRGWGDLGNLIEVPDNIFLLEDCPHDWLFPQCSAVVHHGGAGTTATGLKAGCPTTIVPFFGDQFFWGDRIRGHPKFWEFTKRACTKLMKVLVAIKGRHPYTFGDNCVLPPVLDFCLNKITAPELDILSFEQFLIQCMVLVKSVLECQEYKPSLTGRVIDENGLTIEQMKKNISNAVGGVLSSVLPKERIVLLCNVLIRRYFVLTASDLEEWYQNPEAFHHEQDMVQWTEKLRPCAEALYIVLFENHSQLLGPVVVSILQEAIDGCSTSVTEITPVLLLKDAAYGAAAYVYYELSNYLSFKDWFNGALSLELSNHHPNMHIIHRKITIILGQWVSEIKDDTRRAVYCALIKLLLDKDLSVRLAACRALCLHIEDANFSERDFTDLLPICWDSCFKLIEEVQEFDSKVQVLYLISVLIGHVSEVLPYANKLVHFFQKVWGESSGESLLQMQLLIALRNFVVALGYQSPNCYSMLLPILQRGIDINSPDELNLLEDSMLLWEATISHAPSMVPQLLAYFPCLLEIMEQSFDHLQVAVNIVEGYIILGGTEFLSMHASCVAKLLDLVVGNVNDKGLLTILPIINMLIQCFPIEVPPLISSTLQKLIVTCLSGGDDREPSKTAVKASSAAILARILVMNTNYLAQLTSEPSLALLLQQAGIPIEENILLCLVDIWLDKVDNVSSVQKKIFAFALSIILTMRLPQVLHKLDQILSICTSVILGGNDDLADEESSGDNMSSSNYSGEGTIPSKELRRRQMKFSDPVNQLSLENSVRENLQTCATLHGESFNSAMSRMHSSALMQLKQALKMQ